MTPSTTLEEPSAQIQGLYAGQHTSVDQSVIRANIFGVRRAAPAGVKRRADKLVLVLIVTELSLLIGGWGVTRFARFLVNGTVPILHPYLMLGLGILGLGLAATGTAALAARFRR